MIRESRLLRDIICIIALVLTWAVGNSDPASASHRGSGASVSAPICTSPNTTYDGCLTAHQDAQFQDVNLIANYARDVNGNTFTLQHDPAGTFNPAGIKFPVGLYGIYKTAANRLDPRTQTVRGSATITGGTTITWTAITNGGTPQAGMTVWDDPGGGSAFYPNQMHITGAGCTGSLPTIVCTLDQTVSNHSFSAFASFWPGCTDIVGSGSTPDNLVCNMRNSAAGWTTWIIGPEFGPVNGHNATFLSGSSATSGTFGGNVTVDNAHCAPDSTYINTHACIEESSAANLGLNLSVTNSECDGGNDSSPVTGPYANNGSGQCIKWASAGTALSHTTVTTSGLYIHGWTANPINISTGNQDYAEQSNVFINTSLNCGNSGGNICHGAAAEFGTSNLGTAGTITIKNRTVAYSYGATLSPQNVGITAPIALLGGLGSALAETVDIEGATIICNGYSDAIGTATCSEVVDPFRIGSIPSLIAKHIFVNEAGVGSCLGIGGDLQASGSGTAKSSDNGNGTSTWTSSGWAATNPIYYPGQAVVRGSGSSATTFKATLADNGNGTSTMAIQSTSVGSTTNLTNSGAITPQIVALNMADWQAHPTLVVSQIDSTHYIVSNGSGSGENQPTSQTFKVAQVILPFGQGGTTATGGTAYANYGGTILLGGNNVSVSTADNNWSTTGLIPGNHATLATDVSDNWMMATAGSTAQWSAPDGPNASTSCPNSSHN